MRLRYTTDALAHLQSINRFLSERNPAAARRIMADIRAAGLRLCVYPRIGRRGQVAGTHEWAVQGSPYILVYEIDDARGDITVLGVFHGAQDWPDRLS